MAGVKGRSGGAHGGPQYNPANVNGNGGDGQSGDYKGFAYGQNKAVNEQMAGAPLAKAMPAVSGGRATRVLPPVTEITAPTTNPDEPITTGVAIGKGAGPEALKLPQNSDTDVDKARLISYLPALEVAANQPNSSQAFRNYVRLLKANLL